MRAAPIWIVQQIDIVRRGVGETFGQRLRRPGHRADMHRNMVRLCHQPAPRIDQRDGEIPRGVQDLRVGGAQHRLSHFLGDGVQPVLQHGDGDRVRHGGMVANPAPLGNTSDPFLPSCFRGNSKTSPLGKPMVSAVLKACGPVNPGHGRRKVDAIENQITLVDHRRSRGPVVATSSVQQLGPNRGAAEKQNLSQARDRRERPDVPPSVRTGGGRENFDDQNRIADVVFFGFISRAQVTARSGIRKFSLARTRGTISCAATAVQGLPARPSGCGSGRQVRVAARHGFGWRAPPRRPAITNS